MIEDLPEILNYLRMTFEIPADGFCDVIRSAVTKTLLASKTGFLSINRKIIDADDFSRCFC